MKPGYKKTEAGLIPDEWTAKQLRSVLSRGRLGGNYPNQDTEAELPLMKMGNIARGFFDMSKVEYLKPGVIPEDQHRLSRGDVLFNTRNTLELVGKVAIWRDELPVAYYNSNLMRLEFDQQEVCSNEYANYALNTAGSVARLRALATGTTSVAAIYTRDLLGLQFVVPPPCEQRAIAGTLSDVDALLGGLDRLIAKKRDLKQAVMQQLLTGQTRLAGFTDEWLVRRLGDHVTFLRHGVNSRAELQPEGHVKYVHYGEVHACGSVYMSPEVLPSLPQSKAMALERLSNGDLVIADASEDTVGVSKSVEMANVGETEVVAGLHTIAARFDKSVLADGFKGYLQFCPPFTNHLRRLAAGTKVYATNRGHVASIQMALPSVAEQIAIAAVLSDMDAEIATLEQRREKTRVLKQAMMQELLTGRTRLVQPEKQEELVTQ
ncbi:MAG: restriction endonuclease subunit S [Betaproteobacteria bacterium]